MVPKTLILIPTPLELRFVTEALTSERKIEIANLQSAEIALCGFGLAAAGARAGALLERFRPQRVILLGIAGTLSSELIVGEAYSFGRVVCHGIGVGGGADYQSSGEMGWKHWAHAPSQSTSERDAIEPIGDLLDLADTNSALTLLSCAAASGDKGEANAKREQIPQAAAEDMEGFSVAVACTLSKTPLSIVRGISNVAGHREHSKWKIAEAMQAAIRVTAEALNHDI